jgi:bilirubin oxidase
MSRLTSGVMLVAAALLGACGPRGTNIGSDANGLASKAQNRLPLDPALIPQFETQLVVPPAMPKSTSDTSVDYQIAVRQFSQQILPPSLPATTVWSYGSVDHPGTFNYPAFTIESQVNVPTRVKWINDLKDPSGKFLPHLLPVDQTLHWANPPQQCADGMMTTDCRGRNPSPYLGPVPMVVHVHGAHVGPESDGAPQAWWLPDAKNVPANYARYGSEFASGGATGFGNAIFTYTNDQRATTLWYHDHTLGMTRLNVYAGPAGFYLLRGGDPSLQPTVGVGGPPAPRPRPPPGRPPHPVGGV